MIFRSHQGPYLKDRGGCFSFFVEHERPILHLSSREEPHVSVSRKLLRSPAGRVVRWRNATDRTNDVQVVGNENSICDDEEKAELLQDGDLRHILDGNSL